MLREVDRVQIERMLTNLLSNAVSLLRRARARRTKIARAGGGDGCRRHRVRHPSEYLPHIFDRFYRVPGPGQPRSGQGLGLGLSFVAWIVKAHHGTIDVQSRPGKGTRFTIELPAGRHQAASLERLGSPL